MAKPIIAQTAQESTKKGKTASCPGCGQRFPRRKLREVGPEEASWILTVPEGRERFVGLALVNIECFDALCVGCTEDCAGGVGTHRPCCYFGCSSSAAPKPIPSATSIHRAAERAEILEISYARPSRVRST